MGDRTVSPSPASSEIRSEDRRVDHDLCDVCQGMRIDSLIDWVKYEWEHAKRVITLPEHLEHGKLMEYGAPSQLARRLNCSFCRLILRLLNRESFSSIIPEEKPGSSRGTRVVIKCVLDMPYWGFSVLHAGRYSGRIGLKPPDEDIAYAKDECLQSALQSTVPFESFQLDPDQIRLWIQECIASHDRHADHHISPRYQAPIDLVFIDVSRGCLVKGSSSSRFIALSYVWGQVSMLQTTTRNRSELEQDGALFSKYPDLPAVIQDAILLVRMLDERFLWVDALCIEQDNITQKHTQIAQMDVVYSHSFLTVIALSGFNATACLPGVRLGTRIDAFAKGTVKGHELHTVPTMYVDDAVYETRAWTLQERLLSRRCLYFTPYMVVYTCHAHLRPEKNFEFASSENFSLSYSDLNQRIQHFETKNLEHQSWIPKFEVYASLVYDYTKRELTYPKDMLFAFSGILSVLRRYTGSCSLSGLLEQFLDLCLLWVACPWKNARRNRHFPSWSWAGWTGQCGYLVAPPSVGNHISRLPTYHNFKSEIENFQSRYVKPYRTVRRAGTVVESMSDVASGVGDGQDILLFEAAAKDARMFGMTPPRQMLVMAEDKFPEEFQETYVQVRSWMRFHLRNGDYLMLYDPQGRHCGMLYGMKAQENPHNRDRELVLLSRYRFPVEERLTCLEQSGIELYVALFDHAAFEPTEWCLLNVMLIEWVEGRAERLTIGYIHETAWLEAKPERKRIKLY